MVLQSLVDRAILLLLLLLLRGMVPLEGVRRALGGFLGGAEGYSLWCLVVTGALRDLH